MAVTFRAAGALATNAVTTTLNVVAPAGLVANDILVVAVLGKDNLVITFPGAQNGISAWTKFVEVNNTTAQRLTLGWARVTDGGLASGSTIAVTKPTDNNLLFCGVCSAWIGAITTGNPTTGAGTPTTSANASADAVTYATFDPLIASHVVAVGVYNDDATTAGAISGTDPTFTNRWDLETLVGTDGSIFGYSGDSTGAATGARSHSTTSGVDAINIGCLFGLEATSGTQFTQTVSGGLTFAGSVAKEDRKPLTGGLTLSGAFSKLVNRSLTGGLTFVGSLTKLSQQALTGALTFAGSVATSVVKTIAFTASLSFSSGFGKQTSKALTGNLSFVAAVVKGAQKVVTGALTFAGSLTTLKQKVIAFTAALTFSGTVTKQAGKAVTGALSFIGTLLGKLAVRRGSPFLFTSANWGTQSFFLEVYMRATVGTAEAELYNVTDNATVANSGVSTTSTSLVRLRSTAITLVNGKEYRVQLLHLGPDGGAIVSARLIAVP